MATNIRYVLKHKSKFFDTFFNDLQTVSIEYRKWLKKVGILRVKYQLASCMSTKLPFGMVWGFSDLGKIRTPDSFGEQFCWMIRKCAVARFELMIRLAEQ